MNDVTAPDGLRIINEDDCRRLLRDNYVGRLGYVDGDRPVIVPVNYRVTDDGDIAILTAPGAKYDAAAAGTVMCLQVDEVDAEYHAAWSVLATGASRLVEDESTVADLAHELRLRPWASTIERTHMLLITPTRVEGRRLH